MRKALKTTAKTIFFAFIICMIGCTNTPKRENSRDHLEPVRGFFDLFDHSIEYRSKIRKILFDGLSNNPVIRFQTIPSFIPEDVLVIEFDRNSKKYHLIYHICEEPIWYNENWENVKVNKFKVEIDEKSVDLIRSLFDIAIAQVRFPREKIVEPDGTNYYTLKNEVLGSDGTNYYFSIYGSSGMVWSPHKSRPKMVKLVDIGNKLIELAKSNQEIVRIDIELQREIKKLIKELK
jgi:hypothetical protein